MGGGLIQLVANGVQDRCLVGNPQITFFKVVFRRHSNFSIEMIPQALTQGTAGFSRRMSCHISRSGDLIHRVYLQVNLKKASWLGGKYRGLALIKSVDIEIGGQRIDKHYGEWMYIWNELSLPVGKIDGYRTMIGYDNVGLNRNVSFPATSVEGDDTILYIPLEFWFCRNTGLSLPLIAIQYHEVIINVEFENRANAFIDVDRYVQSIDGQTEIESVAFLVDYIFLDTDERRRFAQQSHEYLIEQVQYSGEEKVSNESGKVNLLFNHPVKELVWVLQRPDAPFGIYDGQMKSSTLLLNATARFANRPAAYFDRVQPYQHHTNIPTVRGIYVYSFALRPEDHQPSGSLNFSQMSSAELMVRLGEANTAAKIRVYAVNYNILRVMSGMSGTAFSN